MLIRHIGHTTLVEVAMPIPKKHHLATVYQNIELMTQVTEYFFRSLKYHKFVSNTNIYIINGTDLINNC